MANGSSWCSYYLPTLSLYQKQIHVRDFSWNSGLSPVIAVIVPLVYIWINSPLPRIEAMLPSNMYVFMNFLAS
jgi:hypothetical protein